MVRFKQPDAVLSPRVMPHIYLGVMIRAKMPCYIATLNARHENNTIKARADATIAKHLPTKYPTHIKNAATLYLQVIYSYIASYTRAYHFTRPHTMKYMMRILSAAMI